MPKLTENLQLFEYDTSTDMNEVFSIDKALNENWEKIDLNFKNITRIGQPIICLENYLDTNEIWLEGAEVSRTTYSELYSIYGTTYGSPSSSSVFKLPDFRNRALWGADNYGYIEAGAPNITGYTSSFQGANTISGAGGCFYTTYVGNSSDQSWAGSGGYNRDDFDASRSNPIYGNSDTIQPPAIKIRVKTRYK